jgi:hypothetical protein
MNFVVTFNDKNGGLYVLSSPEANIVVWRSVKDLVKGFRKLYVSSAKKNLNGLIVDNLMFSFKIQGIEGFQTATSMIMDTPIKVEGESLGIHGLKVNPEESESVFFKGKSVPLSKYVTIKRTIAKIKG